MTTNKEIEYTVKIFEGEDQTEKEIKLITSDIKWSMEQYCRNRFISDWEIVKINFNCKNKKAIK